jgi:hypothetical protein
MVRLHAQLSAAFVNSSGTLSLTTSSCVGECSRTLPHTTPSRVCESHAHFHLQLSAVCFELHQNNGCIESTCNLHLQLWSGPNVTLAHFHIQFQLCLCTAFAHFHLHNPAVWVNCSCTLHLQLSAVFVNRSGTLSLTTSSCVCELPPHTSTYKIQPCL